MFDLNVFKARTISGIFTHPAWELLERCVNQMSARGVEPYTVNSCHDPKAYDNDEKFDDFEIGRKYIEIGTVYRNNGTAQDVSVNIEVFQKYSNRSARRTLKIKVPNDASDKVINKRLDKVVEELNRIAE